VLIRWRTVRSLTRTVTPQPHADPRAVRLQPLGDRRPETRYILWVIFMQRVAPVVATPSFEVDLPIIRLG